jgi:gamma-glutamylcyclotransferase (GGCT)/AIG2-like uncharacterized protein YtfP
MKNERYMTVAERVAKIEAKKRALIADKVKKLDEERDALIAQFKIDTLAKINEKLEELKAVGVSMTIVDNIHKGAVTSSEDGRLKENWIWVYNIKTGSQKRIRQGEFLPDGYGFSLKGSSVG